ncbi:3466_t:CDS:1, partial [Cetraspora pellucida]
WMLQEIENEKRAENLKMNMLQAIHFLIQSWDEVSISTIQNCWSHMKILSADTSFYLRSPSEDLCRTADPVLNDILNAFETLDLPNPMPVKKFLAIPEENTIYEVPSDDQVITNLVKTFRADEPTTVELEDVDDSFKIPIVNANTANVSLETVRTFLLQQNDAEEYINALRKVEKFIKKVKVTQMQQCKIDQFFTEEN